MPECDVLVVGDGVVGLRAAIAAKEVGARVAPRHKTLLLHRHSAASPNGLRAGLVPEPLECASHAGALGSEAMLPTLGMRSMASHRKGGSTAPAVQGAEAAILTVSRKKSWTVLGLLGRSASASCRPGLSPARVRSIC
jgi:glycine/D-amino acid oxidase-like deaminating enzyme